MTVLSLIMCLFFKIFIIFPGFVNGKEAVLFHKRFCKPKKSIVFRCLCLHFLQMISGCNGKISGTLDNDEVIMNFCKHLYYIRATSVQLFPV